MLVPGYGPVRYLAGPLPARASFRGFWLNAVMNAVQSGGAQKDIFPSLHTAGPCLSVALLLPSPGQVPFKYTWPFVVVFHGNIVIATMFLRWHYLIDVLAGLALALGGHLMLQLVSRGREVEHREANGLGPVWLPFRAPPAPRCPRSPLAHE